MGIIPYTIEKYHSLIIWPKIQFFYASLRNAYFGWRLCDRGEKNACVIYLSADPSIHPSIHLSLLRGSEEEINLGA